MPNVWDAMKKHQAEEGAQPGAAESQGQVPAQNGSSAPVPRHAARFVKPGQNGYSEVLTSHHDRGGTITEQYRALRTHLLAQYPGERFCIMVTSAEAGEGKTVTCLNTALVLAELQERRTLVVDCDLRRGRMASHLNLPKSPGMVDLLLGQSRPKDVIRPTLYPNLFILPSGDAKDEMVGELLGHPEVEEIIAELRKDYDYVLVDTPPVNTVSDAGMLGRAISEALIVVRMNKTHRESVDRAIRLLRSANVKPIGMVLTHQKYHIPHYLYRYS